MLEERHWLTWEILEHIESTREPDESWLDFDESQNFSIDGLIGKESFIVAE